MSRSVTIHIALAADQNFFPGLLTTAASIAWFAKQDCILHFHILDGGISGSCRDMLAKKITALHRQSRISHHQVTEKAFDSYPEWRNTGRMAYARLLLGDLLPAEVSHVIYCDTDFFWLRDISVLWEMCKDTISFISTRHGVKSTEDQEVQWFSKRQIPFYREKHFCSGLSFFNISIFRQENLFKKTLAFLYEHNDVNAVDESALNAILATDPRVLLVDQNWAKFTFSLSNDALKQPITLHFSGRAPWKNLLTLRLLTDATLLWFRFYAIVKGVSTWCALREFYSPGRIILARYQFVLLAKIPFISPLLQRLTKVLLSEDRFAQIKPFLISLPIPSHLSQRIAHMRSVLADETTR